MKRLLFLVLLVTSNSFAAGIQKWTDDKGQVHYGDSPPVKTETESVRVSRPPSDPGKPLPRFTPDKAADAASEDQKKEPETSEEQAKAQCEQAQKDLAVINRSSKIRLKSNDGSVRYMSKEEIEERRSQSEEDIKLFCQ